MFGTKDQYLDLAYDLRDKRDWKPAVIRELDYLAEPHVIAVEGGNGLIAVGTKQGRILLFGALPTTHVLRVPGNREVKLLQFAALVFKLVCIDDMGTLHVWDLSTLGNAKLVASESFAGSVCSLTTSPNHSHAFVGTERGIMTYDMLCLTRSPYFIPKVWKTFESNRLKMEGATSFDGFEAYLVDVVIHPRDLNLVFVAFSTGVVLFDLTERTPIRRYEIMIAPGCPGALGYNDPDLMLARHPTISSIAVHASGQMFAVGCIDGGLAIWAVDDEGSPLQVRTIDNIDINFPDGEQLEEALSKRSHRSGSISRPEPIFKLGWSVHGPQTPSDPYNCEHVLVVLGGRLPGQGSGLTALHFPPLVLPTPSSSNQKTLDSSLRKTLTNAFSSAINYSYPSIQGSVISDFQFVPKDSSLFNGACNPEAILTLVEGRELRSIEAWEYPPPSFGITITQAVSSDAGRNSSDILDTNLASTFKELSLEQCPQNLTWKLPTQLWTGFHAICDGDITHLENESYELLTQLSETAVHDMSGMGKAGIAWVNYGDHDQVRDLKSTKRQFNRMLVTHHKDLTIRYQDISPQLLIGSVQEPLPTQYPAPLHNLTIYLIDILEDDQVRSVTRFASPMDAEIQSAYLTAESSECCVVLRTGHVFAFKFSLSERPASRRFDIHEDVLRLTPLPGRPVSFQPLALINNTFGQVECCEFSEIGFIAISYRSGALIVADLRVPCVIYRDSGKVQKRISLAVHIKGHEEEKKITSMRFVICGEGEDATPRVRLIASQKSGDARVYTLSQTSDRQWQTNTKITKVDGPENTLGRGIFVLKAGSGGSRVASQAAFRQAVYGDLQPSLAKRSKDWDMDAHCFLLIAGEKGARCYVNISGARAGKADWGRDRRLECVQVIERNGGYALMAILEDREVLVYSIPALDLVQSFRLTKSPASLNVICLDDTGDYVDWAFDEKSASFKGATLGTVFSMHRVFDEPIVDFAAKRKAPPTLPPLVPLAPVSYLGSWFNFSKGKSGDSVDALLAGPERPIPQEAETSTIVNSEWQKQMQMRAQTLASQASAAGSNLYSNLSAAMSERGEVLQSVQESAFHLEEGGRQMLSQAKRLAAAQTGKRWFAF